MVKTGWGWRWVGALALPFALLGPAWAGTAERACSAETFPDFVTRFGDDVSVQRGATSSPLHWQRMDLKAQPEPQPVLKTLAMAQLPFPVMPLVAERQRASLLLDVEMPGTHLGKVTLHKADTDYLVNYYFVKKDCWSLVRIDDWSL